MAQGIIASVSNSMGLGLGTMRFRAYNRSTNTKTAGQVLCFDYAKNTATTFLENDATGVWGNMFNTPGDAAFQRGDQLLCGLAILETASVVDDALGTWILWGPNQKDVEMDVGFDSASSGGITVFGVTSQIAAADQVCLQNVEPGDGVAEINLVGAPLRKLFGAMGVPANTAPATTVREDVFLWNGWTGI